MSETEDPRTTVDELNAISETYGKLIRELEEMREQLQDAGVTRKLPYEKIREQLESLGDKNESVLKEIQRILGTEAASTDKGGRKTRKGRGRRRVTRRRRV